MAENIVSLVLVGSLALLGLLRLAYLKIAQFRRLDHIKGPLSAALSSVWLVRCVGGGRTHLEVYEACKKYGSIVRIGPNHLITDDPELLKRILNVRTQYRRSDWYNGMQLDPGKDNVLSARDDNLHRQLRAKMVHGYSGKEVEGLEAKIDQNVLRLIDLLDRKYISASRPFDFGRKAQFFTLDVISDLAFGKPFGDIEGDTDMHEYIHTMEQNMPKIVVSTVVPWITTLISTPMLKPIFMPKDDEVGIGKTAAVARKVVAERFGPEKVTRKDMLGSFIAHGLTQTEAESEILMQILAGSDTTATALRATVLHIITNPRVLQRLRKEVETANPSWPVIADAEARNIPYLQAVIKEGLRIFPPVVGLMFKEVPNGGDVYKGVALPEGTKIGWCAWGIFRRPEIWGDDASEFRPERWLDAPEETIRQRESTLELVFGYGRWQCLGRNIALMELNKIVVELVRRYDLTLIDPTNPWYSKNCGIFLQSEFWIRGDIRE